MNNQNKWIAAILSFFIQPLGMLYLAKIKLAILYFLIVLFIGVTELYLYNADGFYWLEYFSFNYIAMFVCAIHSYKIAKSNNSTSVRPWYSKWYGLLSVTFMAFSVVFLFRSFFYEPFRVPASSMVPTVMPGSYLIVKKWGYGNYGTFGINILKTNPSNNIERGDLIVFKYPRNPEISYFKRVIGLPGEKIEYNDKTLSINNNIISTEFLVEADNLSLYEENLFGLRYDIALMNERPPLNSTYVIPEDHYFVLGDNRDNSNDSRYWGALSKNNIEGKIIYTISN